MDPNAIAQLISTLGFPIVCCGALFWFQNKTIKDFSSKIDSTMDKLSDSINANTDATTRLVTTVELIQKIGEK